MSTVTAEKLIKAPINQAYHAFTNATAMRNWLCDLATVEPRPHGRIYLWWNGDFYSSGEYREVEENKKVSFLWHSRNENQPTLVTVTFHEQDGGTLVKMAHTVPDEPSWDKIAASFQQHWQSTLEALAFLLETGMDYRLASRPMLGIIPGDFTPEQAKKLGAPVTDGLRLDGVVDGMGAQKSGLQKDDIIVSFDGHDIRNDFSSLAVAVQGKKGGDVVEVVFYRGAEKKTIAMELSHRPMVDVPFNPQELALRARKMYQPALAALEKCFEGATDAQATAKPAPAEWSALEVIAHLVQGERGQRGFMDEIVGGYERWVDNFGGNIDAHVHATVAVYPTVRAMLDELRRNTEETLAYVTALPAEFAEQKGAFYRLGFGLLQADNHIYTHIPQIEAALATAKK